MAFEEVWNSELQDWVCKKSDDESDDGNDDWKIPLCIGEPLPEYTKEDFERMSISYGVLEARMHGKENK